MGEEYKRKNKSGKKKKNQFAIIVMIIAVILCLIIFIPKLNKNNESDKSENKIVGSWTTDGYTVYEFDENGNGKLKIPIAEYEFTYKIEENKIFIDFKNEKSIDSDYEYSFESEKLILKGINKTSGTYVFTKN